MASEPAGAAHAEVQSEPHLVDRLAMTMTTDLAPPGRRRRRPARSLTVDVATAIALTGLSALAGLAQEAESPAGIIAAQIRTQGYTCTDPVTATLDRQASQPHLTVWILRCRNASYRVQLVPDMAAHVTQLE
jgi:hypothetical protein